MPYLVDSKAQVTPSLPASNPSFVSTLVAKLLPSESFLDSALPSFIPPKVLSGVNLGWGVQLNMTVEAAQFLQDSPHVLLAYSYSGSPVAGFTMNWGTTSHLYSYHQDNNTNLSAFVENLNYGTTYYYAATAYDTNGFQSDYSNEVTNTTPAVQWSVITNLTGSSCFIPCAQFWNSPAVFFRTVNTNGILTTSTIAPVYL